MAFSKTIVTTLLFFSLAVCHCVHGYVGIAMGGFGGGNTLEVVTSDKVCLGIEANPTMPLAPSGSIVGWVSEYVDDEIYLCGGQNLGQSSECYHLPLGSTGFYGPCYMSHERRYSFSAVAGGQLVVMGGYNDREGWLSSVEAKVPGKCQFVDKPEWELPRKMFSSCAVGVGNKIYIMGGNIRNPYEDSDIADVDVLDVTEGTWQSLEPMPSAREYPGCAHYTYQGNEGILVAGGCNNNCHEHLEDTLFYSFSTGKWTTLPAKLNEGRMGMKMVVIDGKPTLAGGTTTAVLKSIEEFDGEKWVAREDGFQFQRWGYGMATAVPEESYNC